LNIYLISNKFKSNISKLSTSMCKPAGEGLTRLKLGNKASALPKPSISRDNKRS